MLGRAIALFPGIGGGGVGGYVSKILKFFLCLCDGQGAARQAISLGAETRTQKNSPHKCLIQILIV